MSDQSWLSDRIFPGYRIRTPRKSRRSGSKNPEEIPSAKFRKSKNPGDRDRDFEIPKIRGIGISFCWNFFNTRDSGFFLISEFLFSGLMQNPRDSGFFRGFCNFGISLEFFYPGIGIFSWDGILQQKANSGLDDLEGSTKFVIVFNYKSSLYFGSSLPTFILLTKN